MSVIEGVDGVPISTVPKPTGVEPLGSQVLCEILSAQEALGTTLVVGDETKVGAPQGYILAFGPNVSCDSYGFRVGDRVILTGNFTPIPEKIGDAHRMKILVEPHQIKARLTED